MDRDDRSLREAAAARRQRVRREDHVGRVSDHAVDRREGEQRLLPAAGGPLGPTRARRRRPAGTRVCRRPRPRATSRASPNASTRSPSSSVASASAVAERLAPQLDRVERHEGGRPRGRRGRGRRPDAGCRSEKTATRVAAISRAAAKRGQDFPRKVGSDGIRIRRRSRFGFGLGRQRARAARARPRGSGAGAATGAPGARPEARRRRERPRRSSRRADERARSFPREPPTGIPPA